MRFTLMPLFLPPAILGTFAWGVYSLTTQQHDRGFAWAITVGAALAGHLTICLYVDTIDNRLRDLERRSENRSDSMSASNNTR